MKNMLWFTAGMLSGASLYKLYTVYISNRNKNKKDEKVYTVAKGIPLIMDNQFYLEYGICEDEEMFRILDGNGYLIVPSGKILSHSIDTQNNVYTIHFSNGYTIKANKDTIYISDTSNDNTYESAIQYEDIVEINSKIGLASPVFDQLYDFIESKI